MNRHSFYTSLGACLIIFSSCSDQAGRKTGQDSIPTDLPNPNDGIRFVDVTQSVGIHFRHSNGGNGRHYYIETMSGGGAFLDYDGDGWLDILLLQGTPLPGSEKKARLTPALYHNRHGRAFEEATAGSGLDREFYGMGVAVGDYDNDGRPDLYLTALGGNRLFHNKGGGRFAEVTEEAGVASADLSTGATWVDYDLDGRLDLFVCRYMDYALNTDPHCRDPRDRPAYCTPRVFAPTHCLLYHNEGNGRFTDATQTSGIGNVAGRAFGVACADYNGDGWIDLYVTNDLTPNFLFLNNGDGTFEEAAALAGVAYGEHGVARAGMGVDCADYDNDGWIDLLVTNFENEPNSLFHNQGGLFGEQSHLSGLGAASLPYVGWGCRLIDLNRDGFQDIFVANGHVNEYADGDATGSGYAQPCLVLLNQKDGAFTDITASCGSFFSRRLVARGTAFGDYDNDGDLDVLIACNNSAPVLLRNDSASHGQSIQVGLVGNGCNRDALGAIVRVRTGSQSQVQYVRSGGSCLADHDRRLVFGLGNAEVAAVEIQWPCGSVQRLNAPAGSSLRVHEKACLAPRGDTMASRSPKTGRSDGMIEGGPKPPVSGRSL